VKRCRDAIIGQSHAIQMFRQQIRLPTGHTRADLVRGETAVRAGGAGGTALHMLEIPASATKGRLTVNAGRDAGSRLVEQRIVRYEAASFTGADRRYRLAKPELL